MTLRVPESTCEGFSFKNGYQLPRYVTLIFRILVFFHQESWGFCSIDAGPANTKSFCRLFFSFSPTLKADGFGRSQSRDAVPPQIERRTNPPIPAVSVAPPNGSRRCGAGATQRVGTREGEGWGWSLRWPPGPPE